MTKLNYVVRYPEPYIPPTHKELSDHGDYSTFDNKEISAKTSLQPREKATVHERNSRDHTNSQSGLTLLKKYQTDDERSARELLEQQARKTNQEFFEAWRSSSELVFPGNRFISEEGKEILYQFHGSETLRELLLVEAGRAIDREFGDALAQRIDGVPSVNVLNVLKELKEKRNFIMAHRFDDAEADLNS
jgi:hypothetical protein